MKRLTCLLGIAALCAAPAAADVIGGDDFDGGGIYLTFTQFPPPGAFSSTGDGFEPFQRGVSATIPYQLLDDTLTFPTDAVGIVRSTKTDAWFGVTDTVNGDNPTYGPVCTAEWAFDIAGYTDLSVAIDMGAMGDFEAAGNPDSDDAFNWTYSIDWGPILPLFTSTVDLEGTHTYTMEDGTTRDLDDPLLVNGILVDNIFQTLSANVDGTGHVLTLTLTALTDGGSEAYAFDNVVITGIPEPASLLLLGLGAVALIRRR